MTLLTEILVLNLAVIFLLMFALWALSVMLRDASIVDPFWGTGFVVVAWISFAKSESSNWRMLLLAILVSIWGIRLSVYLLNRNWGHGEDRRYGAMREKHGKRFWWISLVTVFLLQGIILWFVSLPLQVSATSMNTAGFSLFDGLGVVIWAVGLFFEAVGDWQLSRFKADSRNEGKVLNTGLWRYTRHPNYFGNFCIWWGIYIVSISAGAIWTILSPLLMSILLLRVSGVTLLEKDIADRRPDYAKYKRRTNAFFPGMSKR